MIIRVLLASNDAGYITRLRDVMSRTSTATGDSLEIALFTDNDKLLAEITGGRSRFHVALVDEGMSSLVVDWVPVLLLLTENDAIDNMDHDSIPYALWAYKYQRVSTLVSKLIMAQAKKYGYEGRSSAATCAFFSPAGGVGTSTTAASFAMAAAAVGVRPMYVSFEYFNSTECFFKDTYGTEQGLYDIFCTITEEGKVVTSIDTAKAKDVSDVAFIKKFNMWTEAGQITPDEIETFIGSAKAANDVDLLVLDLGSGFASFTDRALECADEVFVVADSSPISRSKLDILFDTKTSSFSGFLNKTNLIYNKADAMTPKETYGCKSLTNIPNYQGADVGNITLSAERALRGLIKEEWKPKSETI